jgi:hemoglobin-like flavoprotein
VRATAGVVADNAEQITACFYPRMFAGYPDLLRLFNQGNQATGEQSRALATSVVAYAVQLIDPDAPSFDPVMRLIAHKHVSLGVRPEQYTIVGNYLLAAVGEVLGEAVTPGVADARGMRCIGCSLRSSSLRRLEAGGRRPGGPGASVPGGPAHRGDRRCCLAGARVRRWRRTTAG